MTALPRDARRAEVDPRGAVVAITGASSGIGRACALAFAAAGSAVLLGARRVGRLEEVAREVAQRGGTADVMPLDVSDAAQVSAFVLRAVERHGRLDVLVNNAGYGVRGRVEDLPAEEYERLMRGEVQARLSGDAAPRPLGPQQAAEDVARAIVRAVRHPRPEVYPHRLSRGLVVLNALAPRLVDWMSERSARRAGRL